MDTTSTLSAYEKHEPAIYKWRELNRQKYNDVCTFVLLISMQVILVVHEVARLIYLSNIIINYL